MRLGTFYKDLAIIVERSMDETARRDTSYDAVLHQIYRLLDKDCNSQILHEASEYARDEGRIVTELCATYENLAKSIAVGENTYEKAKESIEDFLGAFEPLLQQLPPQPKLLSIDSKFQRDLDYNSISEALRKELKENGIPLSDKADNVAVSIEETDSKWLIIDKDNVQIDTVRKEEDKLNIYIYSAFLAAKDTFTSMEGLMNNYLLDGISEINRASLEGKLLKIRGISQKDSISETIQQIIDKIRRKVEDLNHQVETFIQIDLKLIRDEEKMLNEIKETLEEIQRFAASLPAVEAYLFSGILNGWVRDVDAMREFFGEFRAALTEHDEEKISQMSYSDSIPSHRDEEKEEILQRLETQKSIKEFWNFKVRWLVGRYDLENAYEVALHKPEELEAKSDKTGKSGKDSSADHDTKSEMGTQEAKTANSANKKTLHRISWFLGIAACLLFLPYIAYPILSALDVSQIGVPIQLACFLDIIALFAVFFLRIKIDKATATAMLLPRLLAAIAVTYFVLVLGSEVWGFAILLSGKGILLAVLLSAAVCFAYAIIEIKKSVEGNPLQRAWKVVFIGLLQSYVIGFVVTTFLGKAMVETWAVGMGKELDEFANQTVLGTIPKMQEFYGLTVFPTILLLSTFTILFVGLFLELLKEKREITEEF